jgi:hypothetical protein
VQVDVGARGYLVPLSRTREVDVSNSVLELLSLAAAYGIERERLTVDGRAALNSALDALTVPRDGERGFSRVSLIARFEQSSSSIGTFEWLPEYIECVKLAISNRRSRTRVTTRDSFDWAVAAPSVETEEDWDRNETTD